jgi:hypothetical protein
MCNETWKELFHDITKSKKSIFSKWTINILERVDNKSLFLSQGAVV